MVTFIAAFILAVSTVAGAGEAIQQGVNPDGTYWQTTIPADNGFRGIPDKSASMYHPGIEYKATITLLPHIAELIDAGRGLLPYLRASDDPSFTYSVYKTPAQQLREDADRMELRDAAISRFREALREVVP